MKKTILLLIAASMLIVNSLSAQTTSKFKGVVFSDYSYNLENHDEAAEDLNAFSIRRVYLTFESSLAKNIKMRFRLESVHGKFG